VAQIRPALGPGSCASGHCTPDISTAVDWSLSWLAEIESVSRPDPQPLFRIVPGPVAEWEITLPSRTPR